MAEWEDIQGFASADDDEDRERAALEDAMRDCGLIEALAWCSMGGTEHCAFRCPFRGSLKGPRHA